MIASAGMNGFGRFGLHLLKYWLDRNKTAPYAINAINDDTLSLEQAYAILRSDRYVRFDGYQLERTASALIIRERDGAVHEIPYSQQPQATIPWLGQPKLVLECSGKQTKAPSCQRYLRDATRLVAISATSWDADATLVYGFNHESFDPARHRVISYGSCTVNGYVPLAHYLHERFGVVDSDVNVVHNIPEYKLPQHQTLQRKFCTLERSGPQLLGFLDADRNFAVNYTVVPYSGVSMLDFRFRLGRAPGQQELLDELTAALHDGPLKGLYGLQEADIGPEVHVGTPYSAVFIRRGIRLRQDNLYLQSYFDTENSVNRYHDLVSHLCRQLAR